MKYEDIFLGKIYQVTKIEKISRKIIGILDNPILELLLTEREKITGTPIKEAAILWKIDSHTYQDLETMIKYDDRPGELRSLYVGEKTLISLFPILKEDTPKKFVTRRKVLKRM